MYDKDLHLMQEVDDSLDRLFRKSSVYTDPHDPFSFQLTRENIDARDDVWLTEEAVNVFIRTVCAQANRQHASAKMFGHCSSQTLPIYRTKTKATVQAMIKDTPLGVSGNIGT